MLTDWRLFVTLPECRTLAPGISSAAAVLMNVYTKKKKSETKTKRVY
jgi:hypothetical protein